MMGAAALLCVASLLEAVTGSYVMTDSTIRTAVDAWLSDSAAAEAAYGHISTWDTSGVTDMSELFCAGDYCDYYNSGAASFNENIGAWDTTEATSMAGMFRGASSFNQPLGDWSFDNIIDMRSMFYGASAFDQDLGWCVDNGVSLSSAFTNSPCESTSCGVVQVADVADCPAPARKYPRCDDGLRAF